MMHPHSFKGVVRDAQNTVTEAVGGKKIVCMIGVEDQRTSHPVCRVLTDTELE